MRNRFLALACVLPLGPMQGIVKRMEGNPRSVHCHHVGSLFYSVRCGVEVKIGEDKKYIYTMTYPVKLFWMNGKIYGDSPLQEGYWLYPWHCKRTR